MSSSANAPAILVAINSRSITVEVVSVAGVIGMKKPEKVLSSQASTFCSIIPLEEIPASHAPARSLQSQNPAPDALSSHHAKRKPQEEQLRAIAVYQ
jgi:hypothetical protein